MKPTKLYRNKTARRCTKCKTIKLLTSFHKAKNRTCGRVSNCKDCLKKISPIKYQQWKVYYKEYRKTPEAKKRELLRWRRFVKKYPLINRARYTIRNLIKCGKIKKMPCVICGTRKTEGHHSDYNKPLDIIWYCRQCHRLWHKHNKPIFPNS